jgi:type III pantothenate kinase
MAKWYMLPFAIAALLRLRKTYDVIYCPDPRGVGIAAVLVGKLIGRRVVFEAATPGSLSCANWDPALRRWHIRPDGWLGAAFKWLPRHLYAAADAIACLSKDIEDEARSVRVSATHLLRVPHGVNLTRFRPARSNEAPEIRSRCGLPADRLLCLFVGRLSREKGVLEILHAWHTLKPEGAILVLVGPDTPGHPLDAGEQARAFAVDRGMQEQVVFFGPVSDPAEILRAADLFVHPSHYEAFGLSVAEALASGLPVVATSVAGLAEYLVHEENALLCPPEAPLELARQLDRLLRDPALRRRLGRAGRATAERRFDPDVAFGALLGLMGRTAAATAGS